MLEEEREHWDDEIVGTRDLRDLKDQRDFRGIRELADLYEWEDGSVLPLSFAVMCGVVFMLVARSEANCYNGSVTIPDNR